MDLEALLEDTDRSQGLKHALSQATMIRGHWGIESWLTRHYPRITMPPYRSADELREVDRWCEQAIPGKWHKKYLVYWFEDPETAIMFRLRWLD